MAALVSMAAAPPAPSLDLILHDPAAPDMSYECSVCRKSFEKRTSRDRHLRRCRRKRPEDTVPRKKACNHCASSKARCDLTRPSCSRCRNKSLPCVYATGSAPPSISSYTVPHDSSNPAISGIDFDDSLLNSIDLSLPPDSFWPSLSGLTESTPTLPTPPNSHCAGSVSSAGSFNHSPLMQDDISLSPPYSGDEMLDSHPCVSSAQKCAELVRTFPVVPIMDYGQTFPQLEAVARLLSSFPGMMRRPTHPPPFIHRTQVKEGRRSETLGICIGLTGLWYVRSDESRKFVWGTVKGEWDRLEKKFDLNAYKTELEKLEAIQALTVYTLLLYFDPHPPVNPVDDKMIRQLEACAFKIGIQEVMWPSSSSSPAFPFNVPPWTDWILQEAKRRTLSTLFLFDRFYHIRKHSVPFSCSMLGEMPLPAVRTVWEATDEATWAEEWTVMMRETQTAAGLGPAVANVGNIAQPPRGEGPCPLGLGTNPAANGHPGDDGRGEGAEMEKEKGMEWVKLKDLWGDTPKMTPWYAGIDALGSAIMADAVTGRRQEAWDTNGLSSCGAISF